MAALLADLDRLYDQLDRLTHAQGQRRPLVECTGRMVWPPRGVYFFFESGEHRASQPNLPRVVRVGTHAVAGTSKSSLWGRLRAHRGKPGGGGNHRGSIFRLHVGAALLAAEKRTVDTWGHGSSAPRSVRLAEDEHERRVSAYIGAMRFACVNVPDDPCPKSDRAFIERNAIALLSNELSPVDPPNAQWLGRHSRRQEIVRSGLWNLNYVRERYDPGFLDVLESYISVVPR